MNRIFRYSGKLAFGLLVLITIAMVIATLVEKGSGSEYVYSIFYGAPWFIAVWATLAIYSLLYLVAQKIYKHIVNFCLHMALLLILIGAMVTHMTAQGGVIHLRQDVPNHFFQDESRGVSVIPFVLKLKSFKITYYSGTNSPSDYISIVDVHNPLSNKQFEAKLSMNNILNYEGYRFYQSSFDDDMQGSILRVNRDIYGIPITYAGYYFLFITMLWMLLHKNGRFRQLLRSPILKKSAIMLIGILSFTSAIQASPIVLKDKQSVSKEMARNIEKTWMLYDGRVVPLQTFARDFTTKLYGKPSYQTYSASQVLAGWWLFFDEWKNAPFFDINNSDLQKLIGISKASYVDFFNHDGSYKLAPYYKQMYQGGKQSALIKDAVKLDEKIQIINLLQHNDLMAVFPYNDNGVIQWFTTASELPKNIDGKDSVFIRTFFAQYKLALLNNNVQQANTLIDELHAYQQQKGGVFLPSDRHRQVEILYNNLNIFSWLFKIALTLGLLTLIAFIVQMVKGVNYKVVTTFALVLLVVVFVMQTAGLLLRSYIAERLPLGNGYETMLFIAWCALFIALLLRRYSLLIPSFGFLIAGFALLVAHLGSMNPKITHLVPVLSSSLLSIHVSIIMFSYALVGFITLNSLTTFVLLTVSSNHNAVATQFAVKKLRVLSELFLYPCVFFLAAGIFVGAMWANVSWGRYWGWDPKEVWALITLLIAALPFHRKTLTWFNNTFFFNVYVLLIFVSVLMTYFGVNYFLGGMHSYAGGADMGKALLWIVSIAVLLMFLVVVSYKKYKRLTV